MLPSFEYRPAHTVAEALRLWAEAPGARYLAGGTDLLPQLRLGRLRVPRVVDVKPIPHLSEIRRDPDGSVHIGSAVTLATVAAHPELRARYGILVDCCLEVGAYALRHRATLAGNLCNASPAADTAVALLALDAEVVAATPGGDRRLPLANFFEGPGRCRLEPGALVTGVVLPPAAQPWAGSYARISRRQGMDLATVGVLVARAPDGQSPRYRVALCAVAPTPVRAAEAEALLQRAGCTPQTALQAAALAEQAARPITDVRGTAEYRREMVRVLVRRGLEALAAGGGC